MTVPDEAGELAENARRPRAARRGRAVAATWGAVCLLGVLLVLTRLPRASAPTQLAAPRPRPEAPRPIPVTLVEEKPKPPVTQRAPAPERPPVPPPPAPAPAPATEPRTPPDAHAGSFPALVASYDAVGTQMFLATMRDLGARVFVGDIDSRRLLAEADPITGALWTGFRPVADLATDRPRVLRDDPGIGDLLRQAKASFGDGAFALVLLVPRDLEAHLMAAIREELERRAGRVGDVVSVRGDYRREAGALLLHLHEAVERAGRTIPLDATVRLVR